MTDHSGTFLSPQEELAFFRFFATRSDYDLCDRLDTLIENRYGHEKLLVNETDAHHAERAVHLLWSIGGHIDNGGLFNLWHLQMRIDDYAEALDEVGMDYQANIVRMAIELLVQQCYDGRHPGKFRVDEWFVNDSAREPDAVWKQLEALTNRYFEANRMDSPGFECHVGAFARKNHLAFLPLLRQADLLS